jgi:cyclophilin family peptidyl-prolyl cis-trans isomerase
MTLRTLLSGLAVMGFVGCAGAQTDNQDVVTYTMADVEASPEAWRQVAPENLVIMETNKGQIVIELLPEAAPNHVDRFRAYVEAGLYDGTIFHRVIEDFMAQGGDVEAVHGADKVIQPNLQAEFVFDRAPAELPFDTVGPADSAEIGYLKGFAMRTEPGFLAEMTMDGMVSSWIPHCPGVLSSARTDDRNSANAQFFLISQRGQHLDEDYTAKGRALIGLDVIQSIKLGPKPNGFPIADPDQVLTVRMATDLPAADRPKAYVQRTDTAEWQAILAEADAKGTPVCDLPVVPAVIG